MQTVPRARWLLVEGNKSMAALMNDFGAQMMHCTVLLDVTACAGIVSIREPAAPLPGQEITTQHVDASL